MEQTYKMNPKFGSCACILLISLFLQNCYNLTYQDALASSNQIEIAKRIIVEKLTSEGWEVDNVYEEKGKLKVIAIEKHGNFVSKPYKFSVSIDQNIKLKNILSLGRKERERVIHLQGPKMGQPTSILIFQSGLLGGMLEGDAKIKPHTPKLIDIKELREYFYKEYLEITPQNYKQLLTFCQNYKDLFMNYKGKVFVKDWEIIDDSTNILDLLLSFNKIKSFKISCVSENSTEIAELIIRAVQFYEELAEIDLHGCQLDNEMMHDIIDSIPSKKLKAISISNNNLNSQLVIFLGGKFPGIQIIVNNICLEQELIQLMNQVNLTTLEGKLAHELEISTASISEPLISNRLYNPILSNAKELNLGSEKKKYLLKHMPPNEQDYKMLLLSKAYAVRNKKNRNLSALVSKAKRGNSEAQYRLGIMYATGRGVIQDEQQAIKWYVQAASQGYFSASEELLRLALKGMNKAYNWVIGEAKRGKEEAQYTLGQIYEKGIGLKKDEEKATEWYIKAAEQEHKKAAYALKDLALKGHTFAQQWLIKKAENGEKEAQYIFGQMYEQGIGFKKDEEKAAEWYMKAAKQDYPFAEYNLCNLALQGNKLVQTWVMEKAEKGDKEAQHTLGQMYEQGIGFKKDEEKAAEWYVEATNQEQMQAHATLNKLALGGSKFAQGWLIKEAERGNKDAQYTLGQIYEQGKGIEKDEEKAAEWYIKYMQLDSCDQQCLYIPNCIIQWQVTVTLNNLALKGNKRAQCWILEEAEKGAKEAQYTLGQIYEKGIGLKKDKEVAIEWYIKAASQGQVQAQIELNRLSLSDNKRA